MGAAPLVREAAARARRARGGRAGPVPRAGCVLAAPGGARLCGAAGSWGTSCERAALGRLRRGLRLPAPGGLDAAGLAALQAAWGSGFPESLGVHLDAVLGPPGPRPDPPVSGPPTDASVSSRAPRLEAYLSLEPEPDAGRLLVQAGVARAVVGLAHPQNHLRGRGLEVLRAGGVEVELLEASLVGPSGGEEGAAILDCAEVNEALLHREARGKPLSILKYAMTLDGKIATAALHSAWVSSAVSRQQVYHERALSDAVIVGGNTVRLDNPRLTTRVEGFPIQPTRVVLSRSLDMPLDAHIWDIEAAPTLVFTEEASCDKHVQAQLVHRGVQVVALTELTPQAVVRECHLRGMVRLFWECGGMLAAPAISDGTVGKVLAFVAPKIIGGGREAPGPVGDLGFAKMTQAIDLVDPHFDAVGPDLLVSGHLPSSGGLSKLVRDCALPKPNEHGLSLSEILRSRRDDTAAALPGKGTRVKFYKAWDAFGALSNFYPSEVRLSMDCSGKPRSWRTVEHFYQAHKFCPCNGACDPWVEPPGGAAAADVDVDARRRELVERIWRAETPENAARVGRWAENTQPELMRPDWAEAKLGVMEAALRAKFRDDAGARAVLLSTGAATLAEYSPRDAFWGTGADGRGQNHLGRLLMLVRASLHKGGQA